MNINIALLLLVLWAGYPQCASAAFYRYYDSSGGVNVTNDMSSIPERYRANVTVVTERELEDKVKQREREERAEKNKSVQSRRRQTDKILPSQSITTESGATAAAGPKETATAPDAGSNNWLSRQLPMLKVMGIIALLIAGFVFVGRLASAFAPRTLAIVIRVAMFAALSVYIFKGLSGKVVDAFSRIKDESGIANKAVEKRSEKIQQAE